VALASGDAPAFLLVGRRKWSLHVLLVSFICTLRIVGRSTAPSSSAVAWLGVLLACLQEQSHLAVGCLDGQLKFFTSTGTPKFKERAMEGDVLSLSNFNTDYMLAGGSDK
jgi:hypothetical protein